ncbi:MAG: hypothetical protein DRN05_06545 [Thermoplasmata archaeon]|nr:MAG: hypothetical protein DRN05_06545 [Thermoplasmata archaeon]
MKPKLRKLDAIIIVALIIMAMYVFHKSGYIQNPIEEKTPDIKFSQDEENFKIIVTHVSGDVKWADINISGDCDKSGLTTYVLKGDEITNCHGTITIIYKRNSAELGTFIFKEKEKLPESIIGGNERSVSAEDEGPHYNKILIGREWWYYTAILNEGLPGWTISISFNHMARNDLFFEKPDILVVTLNGPNGEKYGSIIDRKRPILGILKDPALQATSSSKGFKVSFEDSYVEGRAPNWHIHIEGEYIDPKHDIEMDLQYFAPSNPLWIFSNRLIDKSEGKIASYAFMGCEVSGTVKIDGLTYKINGIGHHEHTWASGLITKSLIRGWDWCHMRADNGWEIYYNNYYLLPQTKSTKTSVVNPLSSLVITTNQGETFTKLEAAEINILDSDKILPFLNLPKEIKVKGKTSSIQLLLKTYNINLDIDIKADNVYQRVWKRLSNVGMSIGRVTLTGKISWSDNDGKHMVDLNGLGTIWNMRH